MGQHLVKGAGRRGRRGRADGFQNRPPLQLGQQVDEWGQAAGVGGLQRPDVGIPVIPGDHYGQVILAYQVPGKQGADDPPVPILKGVDLGEAVVEPSGGQQRVIAAGVPDIFAVPGQQVVQLAVNVFRGAVLVRHSVVAGGIVGQGFEPAALQGLVEPSAELVNRPVRGLAGGNGGVHLPDGAARNRAGGADFGINAFRGMLVVAKNLRQFVGVFIGAAVCDQFGGYAALHQRCGQPPVNGVQALDDAGFDGPAAG